MSAVMMILTNAPITHVPGRGGRRGKSRVDGRSRPARDERNSRGDDRKRDDRKRDDRKRDDFHRDDASPWRTVSALLAMRRR